MIVVPIMSLYYSYVIIILLSSRQYYLTILIGHDDGKRASGLGKSVE